MIQPQKNIVLAKIYVLKMSRHNAFFNDKIETFMNKDVDNGLRITF